MFYSKLIIFILFLKVLEDRKKKKFDEVKSQRCMSEFTLYFLVVRPEYNLTSVTRLQAENDKVCIFKIWCMQGRNERRDPTSEGNIIKCRVEV